MRPISTSSGSNDLICKLIGSSSQRKPPRDWSRISGSSNLIKQIKLLITCTLTTWAYLKAKGTLLGASRAIQVKCTNLCQIFWSNVLRCCVSRDHTCTTAPHIRVNRGDVDDDDQAGRAHRVNWSSSSSSLTDCRSYFYFVLHIPRNGVGHVTNSNLFSTFEKNIFRP